MAKLLFHVIGDIVVIIGTVDDIIASTATSPARRALSRRNAPKAQFAVAPGAPTLRAVNVGEVDCRASAKRNAWDMP